MNDRPATAFWQDTVRTFYAAANTEMSSNIGILILEGEYDAVQQAFFYCSKD
jgi:hypothetical protein